MPGGDGTGPLGLGPMSGRRAGYCAGFQMPGFANPYGYGMLGYGRGIGPGFGGRRGRFRRHLRIVQYPYRFGPYGYPFW